MRDVRSAASGWIVLGVFVVGVLTAVRFATRAGEDAPIALEPAPSPMAGRDGTAEPLASADPFVVSSELRASERSPAAPATFPPRGASTSAQPKRETGWIEGSVLLDEGLSARDVSVVVSPQAVEPGVGDARDTESRRLRSSGEFEIAPLPPGTYDIQLLGGFPPVWLADLRGLRVDPGEACADPRLEQIDIRGRLTKFELDVIDTASRPVVGARIVTAGPEPHPLPRSDERGVVAFGSTQPSLDVLAWSEGYRLTEHRGVGPRTTIVLEAAIAVRVRITAPAAAPYMFGSWTVQLQLQKTFDEPSPHMHSLALVGARALWQAEPGSDETDCAGSLYHVPSPGRYAVLLHRVLGDSDVSRGSAHALNMGTIEVEDDALEQRFDLTIPPRSLESLASFWSSHPELHATDVLGQRRAPR